MLMRPEKCQGWEKRSQGKSKKKVVREDRKGRRAKNHWREREKGKREQKARWKNSCERRKPTPFPCAPLFRGVGE